MSGDELVTDSTNQSGQRERIAELGDRGHVRLLGENQPVRGRERLGGLLDLEHPSPFQFRSVLRAELSQRQVVADIDPVKAALQSEIQPDQQPLFVATQLHLHQTAGQRQR